MIHPGMIWCLGTALLVNLAGPLVSRTLAAADTKPISVEIAAPPFEGNVSIGVFNGAGRCVRVLFQNVPQSGIPSALNGFSITWDGRIDAGTIAAKGEYEIRGITVGDVNVEGVAYHFNDWIDPDKPTAPPIETQRIKLLPNGDFLAIQKLTNPPLQLARYDSQGRSKWSHPLESASSNVASGPDKIYIAAKNQLTQFDIETGASEIWPSIFPGLTSIASSGEGLIGLLGSELVNFDPATRQTSKLADLPPNITMLAVRQSSVLVSDGSHVFKKNGDRFEPIDLPTDGTIQDLAIGKEGAFWVILDKRLLNEFSVDGPFLRELEPEPEEIFISIDATAEDNRIALISKKLDRERVRILDLTSPPDNEESFWKTSLQKESEPCPEFGVVDGRVTPHGDLPPAKAILVSLIENPLFPQKKPAIRLKSGSISDGLWLMTDDGLPLMPIASNVTSSRYILTQQKNSNKLTAWAAVDGAVAEYSISGLENMMQFSSEKISWPPGPRQEADEENVPSKERAPTEY